MHGEKPTSIDAGIYGFIANIYFYDIDTPLKQCVISREDMVRHCSAIRKMVMAHGERPPPLMVATVVERMKKNNW